MAKAETDRYPSQIKYIIGNEACERFSYYGMRNILTIFMITTLLADEAPELRESIGRSNFHIFAMGVYLFPLLGGYIADRFWGKYKTILYLSLVYTAGQAVLAAFPHHRGLFYTGLFLIALGSGGIKPCVSAFVGDQFTEKNKHLVKKIFGWFYWIINFGSFFASLLIPWVLRDYGPRWAFGIPGILMFISVVVFWLGRPQYFDPPPTGVNKHSFMRVVWAALRAPKKAGGHWLDRALGPHPESAVEGAKSVFRVLLVFSMVPVFWALFDQKASTWVVQGTTMDLDVNVPLFGKMTLAASQMQAINPLLVMLLIPFTQSVIYPAFEKLGYALTPLRRMTIGMFVAGVSYLIVAAIQMALDDGNKLSLLWQALPYAVLTLGEVLVSTTGLEFAYSQAPREMKGTIMSFWNLTVFFGNLLVAVIARLNVFTGFGTYVFFAGLIFVAGGIFGLIAKFYKGRDYYQAAPPVTAPAGEHQQTGPKK